MSTQNDIAKQFFNPAFILQVITIIVVAVITFSKLDTRVATVENRVGNLEQLRKEDQSRLTSELRSINQSLNKIIDWQIGQVK